MFLLAAADVAFSAAVWQFSHLGLPNWSRDCTKTSAVVVFFGGQNWHWRERLDTAQQALTDCPQMRGLLVGGARPDQNYSGSEWMKAQLIATGTGAGRLISERRSYESRGNIREMLAIARTSSIDRLVLISDPLHLHRLLFIAKNDASDAGIALETIATYQSDIPFNFFWRFHYEVLAWQAATICSSLRKTVSKITLTTRP